MHGASFRFIQVNDTHLMGPECRRWLQQAVTRMRQDAPAFCLLCGDLTERAEPEHLLAARETFAALGVPTYPVVGNHDYAGERDRAAYDSAFPGRVNYQFEFAGWRFIGLDTTEDMKYEHTRIAGETLAWMDAQQAAWQDGRPAVVFTHFPLGVGVPMRPENADALLARLSGVNLVAVFSGHHHAYTRTTWGRAALITNVSCSLRRENHGGVDAKGYLLCTVSPTGLSHTFIEIPVWPNGT